MPQTATKRINVTFPAALLEELRQYIPRQERNRFIVDIMERELRQLRLHRALQESAGAWTDANHPDLITDEDVDRYVRRLRENAIVHTWENLETATKPNG